MSTPSTSPVRDYVSSTISQIQDGIPKGGRIAGQIQFELCTVSQSGKGGKIDVGILNLGADASAQQTQKVTFAINFPSAAEIATESAIKAKAEYDKVYNEKIREAIDSPSVRAAGHLK